MESLPRLLIVTGAVLIMMGVIWDIAARHTMLGKLPGDIVISKGNFRLYFPVATSLILSAVLSLILWFFLIIIKR